MCTPNCNLVISGFVRAIGHQCDGVSDCNWAFHLIMSWHWHTPYTMSSITDVSSIEQCATFLTVPIGWTVQYKRWAISLTFHIFLLHTASDSPHPSNNTYNVFHDWSLQSHLWHPPCGQKVQKSSPTDPHPEWKNWSSPGSLPSIRAGWQKVLQVLWTPPSGHNWRGAQHVFWVCQATVWNHGWPSRCPENPYRTGVWWIWWLWIKSICFTENEVLFRTIPNYQVLLRTTKSSKKRKPVIYLLCDQVFVSLFS